MTLNIIKGGQSFAPKIYLYGREGIGKTTFVTTCPSPLIIDFDGGAGRYNVDSLKVTSTDELLSVLTELRKAEYRTVAIDTLEALERLIYAEICRKGKTDSIEKYGGGFGKGYVTAGEVMGRILDALSALIPMRKMPVVLGQCEVKSLSDPEGEKSMYIPRANKHLANRVMEWADIVGFATREQSAVTGNGNRVMFYHTDDTGGSEKPIDSAGENRFVFHSDCQGIETTQRPTGGRGQKQSRKQDCKHRSR